MQTSAHHPLVSHAVRPLLLCGLIASLYACGGGSSGGGSDAPPAPITLTGAVLIDQAVSNAAVCVDLNTNGACDDGEPSAPATGSDGKYTLTHQPADAAAATAFNAAPVLARITPASVDAAAPGGTATRQDFVLSAPAGKAAQINPLTTLVQTAVAGGMPLAEAEAVVARQLGVDVASLYDYQDDAPSAGAVLPDTARTMAKVTAYALELGAPLQVAAPDAPAVESAQLGLLNYGDAQNYSYRERRSDGVVQADGYARQVEARAGKAGGEALAQEALFPSLTLTSAGWTRCDTTVPRLITLGSPARTLVCNQSTAYTGFAFKTVDVGGKPMAEVVAQLRAGDETLTAEGIRHDRSIEMDPAALGSATFPEGAQLRTGLSLQLNRSPAYINNAATDRFGFTALEGMIAGRPASAVNLSTPATARATTLGLVGPLDERHVLRVAFIDKSNAQFYACESTPPAYNDLGACVPHSQSAFTITESHGVRLLTFTAFPGEAFMNGVTRGFTEQGGNVVAFRMPAPITSEGQVVSYYSRLNGTAWNAMKVQLGIE